MLSVVSLRVALGGLFRSDGEKICFSNPFVWHRFQVTFEEFIDGIMRCKGPARAIDSRPRSPGSGNGFEVFARTTNGRAFQLQDASSLKQNFGLRPWRPWRPLGLS